MFLGHYAVGVALKSADRRLPLAGLFVAVQLLDVAWGAFLLAGVEGVRIVPGFTASNPLDLYHIPWSHGLVSAAAWALLAGAAWAVARGRGWVGGSPLLVGLAAFSHWPLDWLVHTPDMPLWDDQHKVGLGLWNRPELALGIEIGMFVAALALYYRATRRLTPAGRWAIVALGLPILGVQLGSRFGPLPTSTVALGASALAGFALFAALAGWADRKRA